MWGLRVGVPLGPVQGPLSQLLDRFPKVVYHDFVGCYGVRGNPGRSVSGVPPGLGSEGCPGLGRYRPEARRGPPWSAGPDTLFRVVLIL